MVYRKFETNRAKYILQLKKHSENYENGNSLELFSDIDGLVLENPCNDLVDFINSPKSPYRAFISQAKDRKIPIYGVDLSLEGITKDQSLPKIERQLFGMIPEILPALMFWDYLQQPKEMSNSVQKFWSWISYLAQSPLGEGRNSINAEKIEGFVVDRVINLCRKSRPKIGLIYGAAHVGLEQDLKSKLRRKLTQINWKYFNIGKWKGLEKEGLNRIYEAIFDSEKNIWEVEELNCGLF